MDQTLFVGIVVREPLVSQDIAGIFAFWQAGSVCRTFETVAHVRRVGADVFDPTLIFVAAQGGVLDLDAEDFRWLEPRSVITLDLRDTAHFPHWQHLTRPFSQAHVIQAAHNLMGGGDLDRIEAE